jgi:hypothetical protein
MSLAELRKELRELRKEHVKPVSRMKKGDIASELEKLRERRETTAPVASTHSEKPRKAVPRASNMEESHESEHKMKPAPAAKKGKAVMGKAAPSAPPKKSNKLAKLMKMMEQMSDSDEE